MNKFGQDEINKAIQGINNNIEISIKYWCYIDTINVLITYNI